MRLSGRLSQAKRLIEERGRKSAYGMTVVALTVASMTRPLRRDLTSSDTSRASAAKQRGLQAARECKAALPDNEECVSLYHCVRQEANVRSAPQLTEVLRGQARRADRYAAPG